MASQPDHIKQYTAQDFERYYAGQMTAREMHALEKAALEDPFLADALEGYKHTPTPVADMETLREKVMGTVPARKGQYRNRLLPALRIAALFLLLAGAGWTIYYFTRADDASVAIQRDDGQPATESTVAAPALVDSTLSAEPALQESAANKDVAIREAAPPPQRKKQAAPTEQKPPVVADKAEEENDLTQNRALATTLQTPVQTFAADSQTQPTQGVAVQAIAAENHFKGQVLDERNNPVPNAVITLPNSRTGTVTDINGNFSLNAPDSTRTAVVNAIGFEASLLHLDRERDSQRVVLKEAEHALSEVVVTGYGMRRQRVAAKANTEAGELEPTGGWPHFNDYIASNLKSPGNLAFKPAPGGEVRLSFDVNAHGEPVNIKVEKSLCEECDREAIRLLKEGPKWKNRKNKKGTVTIRF